MPTGTHRGVANGPKGGGAGIGGPVFIINGMFDKGLCHVGVSQQTRSLGDGSRPRGMDMGNVP